MTRNPLIRFGLTTLAAAACMTLAHAAAPYRVILGGGQGSCIVGDPNSQGVVSGTCTDASGNTFNVSGTATAQNGSNYSVLLQSGPGAQPFSANLTFNTASQVGSGSWVDSMLPAGIAADNTPSGSATVIGSQPAATATTTATTPAATTATAAPVATAVAQQAATTQASASSASTPSAGGTTGTTGAIQTPMGTVQTTTGQNLAAAAMSTAGVTCPAGTVQDPSSWTSCVSTGSAYVTGGQYAKNLAALNSSLQAQAANPSYSGNSLTYGGANAVANQGFTGGMGGALSTDVLPSSAPVGTITVPFTMTDGSGSGTCVYNASQVGGINAGTGYDLSGTCTTPSGQTFTSTGTAGLLVGGQPGQYRIQTGFGSINSGQFGGANLVATLDTNTGAVSNVTVGAFNMGTQSGETLATSSGGTSTVQTPYSATAQSTIIPVTLSDGSACTVAANAWYGTGGQTTLSAHCTSANGTPFTLTGKSAVDINGATQFTLFGQGPTGTDYSMSGTYNPSTGAITNSYGTTDFMSFGAGSPLSVASAGGGSQGSSAPFHLTFSGKDSGSCDVGIPDSSGNLSASCVDKNGVQFQMTGTATPAGTGLYHVTMSGTPGGGSPVAVDLTYSNVSNSGSGTWGSQAQGQAAGTIGQTAGAVSVVYAQPSSASAQAAQSISPAGSSLGTAQGLSAQEINQMNSAAANALTQPTTTLHSINLHGNEATQNYYTTTYDKVGNLISQTASSTPPSASTSAQPSSAAGQ